MNMTIKKNTINQYMLIYLMFMAHDSSLYRHYTSIFSYVMLGICIIFIVFKMKYLNKDIFRFISFILLAILIVRLINNGGVGINIVLKWSAIILTTYLAYIIDREMFINRFIKLITFFSIISLIFYVVNLFLPNLLNNIKFIEHEGSGKIYRGLFFYVLRPGQEIRNNGVFNEPGLYQIVLNTAIFLMMYFKEACKLNNKEFKRTFFIILITLISTGSTTGYIGLAFMIIFYILFKKGWIKKALIKYVIILVAILLINYLLQGEDSIFYKTIIEKFSEMGNSKANDLSISMISSGNARILTIKTCLDSIINHPLGIGFDNYYSLLESLGYRTYKATGTTSPFIATGAYFFVILAVLGVIPGIIIALWHLVPVYKYSNDFAVFLVYTFLFFNTVIAQAEVFYPALVVVPIMFICSKKSLVTMN